MTKSVDNFFTIVPENKKKQISANETEVFATLLLFIFCNIPSNIPSILKCNKVVALLLSR